MLLSMVIEVLVSKKLMKTQSGGYTKLAWQEFHSRSFSLFKRIHSLEDVLNKLT